MWRLVLAIIIFLGFIAATVANYMGCSRDTADNYLKQGFIDFQQQKYDGAIRNYERAVAKGLKSPNAYNMLGLAYRYKNQQGKVCDPQLEESEIIFFAKAVEVDPKYLPAVINLAYTYYSRGDKAKAAVWFKQALELNPHDPDKAQMERLIAEGTPAPPPAPAKKAHGR